MSCHGPEFVECQEADVRELVREGATVGVLSPEFLERRTRCDRGIDRVVAYDHDVEHAIGTYVILQLTPVGFCHGPILSTMYITK